MGKGTYHITAVTTLGTKLSAQFGKISGNLT
jgi:Flp pilus assembly pilin Flp